MTCPNPNKWNLLSMDLLSAAEGAELLAHAGTCEECREALGHARRDHTNLLRAFEVFDQTHDELRNELLATQPVHFPRPCPRVVRAWQGLGESLMNLNIHPRRAAFVLAPAACILIAVGIFLFPGKTGVAFAQVLERMRLARTMVCDYASVSLIVDPKGVTEEHLSRGKLSMYSDDVTRAWRLDLTEPPSIQWTFPDHYVHIDAQGRRTSVQVTDDPNGVAALEAPEQWLDRLLSLSEAPDRELGSDFIDGHEVVGFEIAGWRLGLGSRPTPGAMTTKGPSSVVRLWVDPNTHLPVSLHLEETNEGVMGLQRTTDWNHVRWDAPLDSRTFQPPPPLADEPVQEELQLHMAAPSEEALIEGLRVYAAQSERLEPLLAKKRAAIGEDPEQLEELQTMRELLHMNSAYPTQLDLASLAIAAVRESSLARARELQLKASGDDEAAARAAEEGARASKEITEVVGSAGLFYRRLLLEDRDPEYFGATAQPGDSTAVLVRWKHDDQHMRVIYGDLRVETVRLED